MVFVELCILLYILHGNTKSLVSEVDTVIRFRNLISPLFFKNQENTFITTFFDKTFFTALNQLFEVRYVLQ